MAPTRSSGIRGTVPAPRRRPWSRPRLWAAPILSLSLLWPTAAGGQEVLPAVAGGLGGFLVGGYVSAGIATIRARNGDYLDSISEAATWASVPVLGGVATGVTLGIKAPERLGRAGLGGLAGAAVGTGVGILLGRRAWEPPEGAWAGGVIGGAAGLLAGVVVGAAWPDDDDVAAERAASLVIPVGITIRF